MAEAILMLSDKDGAIAMDVSYEGPFDKTSPAHQHMLLLTKAMDTIAQKIADDATPMRETAQAAAQAAGRIVLAS
jgi:hypothetical protein